MHYSKPSARLHKPPSGGSVKRIPSLLEVAKQMDKAERYGAHKDSPEGSRYIILSDTLARQIALSLRGSHGKTS